jgi:phosphoglycerate dehydrogenase-like enzyme
MKFKNVIKKIAAPFLIGSHQCAPWSNDRLHVLIECIAGFTVTDWYQTMDQNCPEWKQFWDVKFFSNFAVRNKYIQDADILIGTWFSGELMKQSPRLKLVQLAMAGTEFLDDLGAGKEIKIATAAGLSARGAAEHVLMLILALDRRLDVAVRQQNRRQWKQGRILRNIRGLRGRTAGIVGMGNIGSAVASLLSGMQMTVVYHDTLVDEKCDGAERCASLEKLLTMSDFVILCVPLNATTRRLITTNELSMMKKSAYLINISRGEVVDERDLARGLKQRVIAGAATDVLTAEPPSIFHPLYGCPNMIITPHVAGNIYTYRDAIRKRFVRNIKAFMSGGILEGEWKVR